MKNQRRTPLTFSCTSFFPFNLLFNQLWMKLIGMQSLQSQNVRVVTRTHVLWIASVWKLLLNFLGRICTQGHRKKKKKKKKEDESRVCVWFNFVDYSRRVATKSLSLSFTLALSSQHTYTHRSRVWNEVKTTFQFLKKESFCLFVRRSPEIVGKKFTVSLLHTDESLTIKCRNVDGNESIWKAISRINDDDDDDRDD